MEPTAKLPPYKSTTVRSIFMQLTPLGLRTLGWLLPGAAARLAERMFLTPRRFPRPAWEQDALGTAQRSVISTPHGDLPVYSWGSGPLVLLVHGWEGRGSQLGAFVPPLLRAGYRVAALDMPGHGDAAPALSSANDFAEALVAVIGQLAPLHAVIGHSMGAAATALAHSLTPFDARLVLIAPPRGPRGFLEMFKRFLQLNERTRAALERRLLQRFGRTVDSMDIALTGPGVTAMTLVIHDRSDQEVPFAHGQLYAVTLPNARLLATDGLGHRRLLRDPAVLASTLAFVSEATGSDTVTHRSSRVSPARMAVSG